MNFLGSTSSAASNLRTSYKKLNLDDGNGIHKDYDDDLHDVTHDSHDYDGHHNDNNSDYDIHSDTHSDTCNQSVGQFDLDEEDFDNISLHQDNTALLINDDAVRDTYTLMGENSILASLQKEQDSKSSIKMAFMNMANSIIGAGIIGQAYAVKKSGLVGGIFLLIALTFVIDWTIRLMVVNAKMSATDSYQATVSRCFGRTGLLAISIAQGAFAFGGSIAYCVIIGDTIPHVIGAVFPSVRSAEGFVGFLVRRNTIIVLFTMVISYPLSLNRDISKLAKASAVALLSMVVIVLVVIIRGPAVSADLKGGAFTIPLLTVNTGFFQGISIISFAFVCHHNSLLIYQSLRKPTLDRFATLTHWSTFVSMVACIAIGLGGFLIFRNKTLANLLNNFAKDDIYANLARFCFGFNMLTTLPLEIFVCREVFLNYFFHGRDYSKVRHFVTTTVLVVASMGVALITCNLGAVLELVGAFSASIMAYILPPMCFLKLSTKSGWRDRALPITCVIFGVTVMVLSSIQTIISMVNDTGTSHCSV